MAAAEVTISGVLYDKLNRTTQQVVLIGDASLTGIGVGGGPMPPGGGAPLPPWYPGHPEHPIPPVVGGGPIYPPNVPPSLTPPSPPNAGDPTTPVPPPAGSGGWPVQPIEPPPYIVVNYPGIGPVTVAPPLTAQPK
jgi:hypothetical protein